MLRSHARNDAHEHPPDNGWHQIGMPLAFTMIGVERSCWWRLPHLPLTSTPDPGLGPCPAGEHRRMVGEVADAESSSDALLRLINGYQVSQAIHVAAALGIAEQLADRSRTV